MFWDKLETLLVKKNMTISELHRLTFISRVAIHSWRKGRYSPTDDSKKILAQTLNVPVSYFDEDTNELDELKQRVNMLEMEIKQIKQKDRI